MTEKTHRRRRPLQNPHADFWPGDVIWKWLDGRAELLEYVAVIEPEDPQA